MKILLGTLLLLFLAAVSALFIARNPGYVLIAREPFVLETSLAVFVLLLIAALVAFYALARISIRLLQAPRDLTRWRQTRRTRRARQAFYDSLALLIGGDWLQAEKALLAGVHATDDPLFAYLAAAVAAHGQHDLAKRDRYLASARDQAGGRALNVDLLHARLLLSDGEWDAAHRLLSDLRTVSPAPPELVRLQIAVSRRIGDWQGLLQVLPEARRRQLLSVAELDAAEAEAHRALLSLDLPAGALDTLRDAWRHVPTELRERPELIAAYARQLMRLQAAPEAATLLAKAIEHTGDPSLLQLFGENPAAQLDTAEVWQTEHGDRPALWLALGRLARRAGRPDQARQYLERCLSMGDTPTAHAELAELHAAQGQNELALQHFRQALGPPPASTSAIH